MFAVCFCKVKFETPQHLLGNNLLLSLDDISRETIKNQIRIGKRRRNDVEVKKVFEQYAESVPDKPDKRYLPKEKLLLALKEFDISSMDLTLDDIENVDCLYDQLDRNGDGRLDLGEFVLALKSPVRIDTIVEWVRSLSIHEILADGIPRRAGEFPLITVSSLTASEVREIVAEAAVVMEEILNNHVTLLKRSLESMERRGDNPISKKFESDLTVAMECGGISDFHGGLVARIGNQERFVIDF